MRCTRHVADKTNAAADSLHFFFKKMGEDFQSLAPFLAPHEMSKNVFVKAYGTKE